MATVTTTPIRTFVSGETVTPAKLNELSTPTISVSSIVNADIDASAAIAGSKLASGAVGATQLGTGAITGQTAIDALANGDTLLIHDDSNTALRKVTWAQIVAAAQPVGSVLQTVYVETTDRTTITDLIPDDDTIPQITEGAQVLTLNITPSSTSNKILLTSVVCVGHSGNYGVACCLFKTGTSNALCTVAEPAGAGDAYNPSRAITYMDSPNTTSQVTYSLRVGSSVSGTKLNDWYANGPKYGQSIRTTLMAQEIKG
jgi:hypothetical protein